MHRNGATVWRGNGKRIHSAVRLSSFQSTTSFPSPFAAK